MTASFAWDYNGAGKTPDGAKALLADTRARRCLSEYWAGFQVPNSIILPANNAILMSGTTSDLQQALATDIRNGVNYIGVDRNLACWYFRRSAGLETKTVVSIACKQGYWGLDHFAQSTSSGYYWYPLYTGTYLYGNGVLVQDLSQQWLPIAKGVKAWY